MEKLKKVIKENDYKVKEIAELLGVSSVTIDNWDKEKTYPTVTQFYNICEKLEIDFYQTFLRVYKD